MNPSTSFPTFMLPTMAVPPSAAVTHRQQSMNHFLSHFSTSAAAAAAFQYMTSLTTGHTSLSPLSVGGGPSTSPSGLSSPGVTSSSPTTTMNALKTLTGLALPHHHLHHPLHHLSVGHHPTMTPQQLSHLQLLQSAAAAATVGHHHHQRMIKFSIDNILSPSFGNNKEVVSTTDLKDRHHLKRTSSPSTTTTSGHSIKRKYSSDSETSSTSISSLSSLTVNHGTKSKSAAVKSKDKDEVISSTTPSTESRPSKSDGKNGQLKVKTDNSKVDSTSVSVVSPKSTTSSTSSTKSEYRSYHALTNCSSSSPSSSSKGSSVQGRDPNSNPSLISPLDGSEPMVWPAWVYCTRYSDRPSSGPRSRRMKKPKEKGSTSSKSDEKRPRTAFTADQLARLKQEFQENRYLTEKRRQDLARDLSLNESQIKIWFQNKRAKIKKTTGQRNPLALHLMAQGLYNHTTAPPDEDDDDDDGRVDMDATGKVAGGSTTHSDGQSVMSNDEDDESRSSSRL